MMLLVAKVSSPTWLLIREIGLYLTFTMVREIPPILLVESQETLLVTCHSSLELDNYAEVFDVRCRQDCHWDQPPTPLQSTVSSLMLVFLAQELR